ncbi:hypothetical protein E6C76_10540 [Pseudothauera nasutitermitis]|uniref:Uncharacterized protein n=1 Tax=Pseudothauera nasutitermitis TaxID=2565930 RepID=A0A4S4B0U4_9RHOO|nr:hypothetical protein [Pseudothauera nasutitermitis]THF64498.1 hypothetical protein E6C76_10540 [Pseudothauera nasutitermitis]
MTAATLPRRIALVAVLLAVAALAWLKPLDQLAERYAEEGLKRAVASFATARALNAVISVVQGTEVSGSMVVGITLTPGQVLDPLNQLVEQFSTLMLAASIAFGAQLLLMKIGASWAVSLVLCVAAAWLAWLVLKGRPPSRWLLRGFVALLLVRFIVPLASLGSEAAYHAFMADEYQARQASLEQVDQGLLSLDAEEGGTGVWEIGKQVDRLKAAIGKLKDTADRIVDDVVRIIVVFLLQTLVLPLLVMWVLLRVGQGWMRGPQAP